MVYSVGMTQTHVHQIVRIDYSNSSPFEGMGDTTGIDIDASEKRYNEMLTKYLQQDYPEAKVTVRIVPETGGPAGSIYAECADPECLAEDMPETIQGAAEFVWQDMEGGWVIPA